MWLLVKYEMALELIAFVFQGVYKKISLAVKDFHCPMRPHFSFVFLELYLEFAVLGAAC